MAHAAFADLIANLAAESKTIFASSTSQLKAGSDGDSASSSSSSRPDDFLALQSALLLCYNAHLTTLASHRALGLSLSDSNGAEMVQNLVRMRLQLEKMKPIEARLRPKWTRWIKAAAAAAQAAEDDDGEEEVNFRPNPSALLDTTTPAAAPSSDKKASRSSASSSSSSSVYRPPKLAPVPYNPRDGESGDKSERRDRSINTHLLSDLSTSLSSNPYSEASSGLATGGKGSTSTSVRARKLAEMEAYEEDNFTRLAQSKKDARKRRRDEEDVALGGATTAGTGRGKVGAGLEEEFGDLLRGSGRKRGRGELDELKQRSKAARGAAAGQHEGNRSSSSSSRRASGGGPGGNRFEKAVKSHQRRK